MASLTAAADAYFTAQAFSNLFRRIFAEGAFAAAFVPSYSRKLAAEGDAPADKLATDALATMAAATIVLTIVAQLAMPWIMLVYSPGYVSNPEKFRLAVVLTQITMPYLAGFVDESAYRIRLVEKQLLPAISRSTRSASVSASRITSAAVNPASSS
mgnify:CR=1 FL=1